MITYLQIILSVTIVMEVVITTVITPWVLTTAPVNLDIDYFLMGIDVSVRFELVISSM